MLNIFLFIRRHFNILLFLFLQGLSISFIVQYSKYHHAAFGNFTNNITGKINTRYSRVQHYFHLKSINDSLVKANEVLYNKLRENYALPDTAARLVVDSVRVDSLLKYKKYRYLSAGVISNSVSVQNNYIVLSRGTKGSLKEGMGVVDPNNAVVGIITQVNENYAVVMSLLHKDSHVSGKLFKGGETGTLSWDGKEPNFITLTNIPKSAKINKGDSIITSGFSTTFPKGLIIGRVEAVYTDPTSNFFKVKFHTAANFYNLQYVYAIENEDQDGVAEILQTIKKEP